MIRAVAQYIGREVYPRSRELIIAGDVLVSACVAVLVGMYGEQFISPNLRMELVNTAVMTYAAIAMGFSMAGFTLAMTLPDREFAIRLAKSKVPTRSSNSYANLLFVFSWTAFCHWLLLTSSIAVTMCVDQSGTLISTSSSQIHHYGVGVYSALIAYCFVTFLTTIITLSQVGCKYIESLLASPEIG